jgi:hypothetical protein
MEISNNYARYNNPTFGAKFLYSDSLKRVVDYSVEKGKFPLLDKARKDIGSAYLTTRLKLDIIEESGGTVVTFSRYIPKKSVNVANSIDDYRLAKITTYKGNTTDSLEFALRKILKLSHNAPNNNMYKDVVSK